MGARISAAERDCNNNKISDLVVLRVDSMSAPDYCFNDFITQCENHQREKTDIQTKLRLDLQKWWIKQKEQDSSMSEHKHRIFYLLNRFRCIQEEQNVLIQKEKVRFHLLKNNIDAKDMKTMKNRLKYIIMLNQEHEIIISKLRQDCSQCRVGINSKVVTKTKTKRMRVDDKIKI